jgi:hypothetical protein
MNYKGKLTLRLDYLAKEEKFKLFYKGAKGQLEYYWNRDSPIYTFKSINCVLVLHF